MHKKSATTMLHPGNPATAGVGTFTAKFDHMAELTGRTAEQIVAARKAAAA